MLVLLEGEAEALSLELGEREALTLWLAEGLLELEGLTDGDIDGLVEADGEGEADGDTDTPKLCIEIIQVSLDRPLTTLNSYIEPRTLPAG